MPVTVCNVNQIDVPSSEGCCHILDPDHSLGLGCALGSVHILGLAGSLGCSRQIDAAGAEEDTDQGGTLGAVEACTDPAGILLGAKVCILGEVGCAVVGIRRGLGVCSHRCFEVGSRHFLEVGSRRCLGVCNHHGPVVCCSLDSDSVDDPPGTAKEDYTAAATEPHTLPNHPAKPAQAGSHHQGSQQKDLQH